MHFSNVSREGHTIIPKAIRLALQIEPGERLRYEVVGDRVTVSRVVSAASLKGALASEKGRGLSMAQIREIAAKNAMRNRKM